MHIQGKARQTVSLEPYTTDIVPIDLYMVAILNEDGSVSDYVSSGRPHTYRVYESLKEARRGIAGVKRYYRDKTFKPVRIMPGEFVEGDV